MNPVITIKNIDLSIIEKVKLLCYPLYAKYKTFSQHKHTHNGTHVLTVMYWRVSLENFSISFFAPKSHKNHRPSIAHAKPPLRPSPPWNPSCV